MSELMSHDSTRQFNFRETALLYKPGVSALSNKQRIAIVVSHELAHQGCYSLLS